jgi:hypothetical protein
MKTTLKLYSFLFILSTFSVRPAMAHELPIFQPAPGNEKPLVEKKKTYSKSYDLSSNDVVTLENRFGELRISTWDKNEIKVEVTMTAKGNTDERASYILDRLSVEDRKTSNGVYFHTDINDGEKKYKNTTYKDEGFSINYVVMMPSKNRLKVSNEFGATILPDYSGEISVESKFGSLTAGKLVNPKRVTVEFGSAEIESIGSGDLEIKFSRAIIGSLDGNVRAQFEHCSGVQLNLDNGLKGLSLQNNFTTLQLNVTKGLSASFNISTNFGDFTNKSEFVINKDDDDDDNHGPKFKKRYIGKVGSGNADLRISSEFSSITVGHSLKMDIKDGNKKSGKSSVNI